MQKQYNKNSSSLSFNILYDNYFILNSFILLIIINTFSIYSLIERSFFDELLKERDERIEAEDSEDASAQIIQVPDAATSFCPDCARKLAINQEELYLSLLTAKLSADLAKCSLYKSLLQTYHEKAC